MKSVEAFKLIGKIKEAHGLQGDFYVLIFSGDNSWLPKLTEFQLKDPATGELFLMKKSKAKPHKQGFILTAEGVPDRTAAEKYHGFHFLIPADLLVSQPGETIFLSEIQNFTVKDIEGKDLGKIVGFSSNGLQDLLLVEGEKKGEIPFVAPFIKEINYQAKYLVMDLPEGLFDLDKI